MFETLDKDKKLYSFVVKSQINIESLLYIGNSQKIRDKVKLPLLNGLRFIDQKREMERSQREGYFLNALKEHYKFDFNVLIYLKNLNL